MMEASMASLTARVCTTMSIRNEQTPSDPIEDHMAQLHLIKPNVLTPFVLISVACPIWFSICFRSLDLSMPSPSPHVPTTRALLVPGSHVLPGTARSRLRLNHPLASTVFGLTTATCHGALPFRTCSTLSDHPHLCSTRTPQLVRLTPRRSGDNSGFVTPC
ncbi:hypothetical protein PYCCODRAFT_1206164 [Trametes coccinea BRFM310]|uniref:Uncharacterized protein n=1 Tax=Trametes coccinea (strain BRFM310) TaxID=1353009 RepID=A0A1Y2I764_TRAC3|nr:hypothetical protein PYCCODRAFT_1206164 [Trametes coccinea BRFM310]